MTPLHLAAKNGHTDIAAILISKGANVNAKEDKYDCAPLMYAVWGGNEDMIRLLLANGAEINITEVVRDEPGESRPFHTAIYMGDIDIVKLLISHGADVNLISHMGWRPLHVAIYGGDIDIVKLLISSDADVNATAEDGFSPLHHAVMRGKRDLVKLLLAKGATGPAFHMAACAGDLPEVKRLVKEGRNVDEKDGCGWTPLHWSLGAGQNQVAELLLANGANVNATTRSGTYAWERTLLHWTVRTANLEGIQLL
ncbi:MAG: ankyrin repeat domain-containing protein, partial [Planctomycetota bacterium]